MKISMQKLTWMSVGCVFALLTGASAMADDTELMLINPDPTSDPTAVFLWYYSGRCGIPVCH